jgi:hypothetical protein
MNRPLLWVTSAVLGAAAVLLTSLGLLAVVGFLLLASPLWIGGDRPVALSGLLTGFGATWSFLLARQFASGGTLGDAQLWGAVGLVPLVAGCTILSFMVLRSLLRPGAAERS